MKKYLCPALAGVFILFILSSCNTSARMQCPGFAAKRTSHKGAAHALAFLQHKHKTEKPKTETASATPEQKPASGAGLFALGGAKDKSVEIEIPQGYSKKLSGADIESANDALKAESNSKITLTQRENKLYFKANTKKDLTKFIAREMRKKPASVAAAPGGGGGIGLAAGIIGIVAFVLAFGPYISFLAVALAIVAVILGILGLGGRFRGWAIAGIILGLLALIISFLFIFVVFFTVVF